jgi:serine/threonine protein kinase
VLIYQRAEHQSYRSRFGAVSNKLAYALCSYWRGKQLFDIFFTVLVECSLNCSIELCVQAVHCLQPLLRSHADLTTCTSASSLSQCQLKGYAHLSICYWVLQAEAVLAYFLRGLMDLCIYPPRPAEASFPQSKSQPEPHEDSVEAGIAPEGDGSSPTDCDQSQQHETRCRKQRLDSAPLSASCTDEAIRKVIKDRDPTHQGLPNQAAVRLLLSLLHWNPANRPTAAEALRHAFFALPLDSELTIACHNDRNLIGWW